LGVKAGQVLTLNGHDADFLPRDFLDSGSDVLGAVVAGAVEVEVVRGGG
jgi:hypothetical protein